MAKNNKITIKVDADMSDFDKILDAARENLDKLITSSLMGHMPLKTASELVKSQLNKMNTPHNMTYGLDVAGPATDTTVLYSVKSKQAILEEMQGAKIMEETKSSIEVYKSKGRKVKL